MAIPRTRFNWHATCFKYLFIAVPTFITSIFCTAVIAAALAFALIMLSAALEFGFGILREVPKTHIYLEIIHNTSLVATVIGFGILIGCLMDLIAYSRE